MASITATPIYIEMHSMEPFEAEETIKEKMTALSDEIEKNHGFLKDLSKKVLNTENFRSLLKQLKLYNPYLHNENRYKKAIAECTGKLSYYTHRLARYFG